MSIMRTDTFSTVGMSVEEKLGALIQSYNISNHDIRIAMNHLDNAIAYNNGDICELFDITRKLTKGLGRKASKLGLALVVIGGIVYIIKNEKDKDNMRTKLLELDKQERSCYCSIKEDEGEALDGEGPLGI